MTKFFTQLLDAPEPMFSISLRELEMMSGRRGIDVAYLADIIGRAHSLMRSIGLDPADTSPEELYQALKSHADDDQMFHNMDDVGLVLGDQVVSFNQEDVRANAAREYSHRQLSAMRQAASSGLFGQYEYVTKSSDRVQDLARQAGFGLAKPRIENQITNEAEDKKKENQVEPTTDYKPKILCVGDIITDAFIKLNDEFTQSYTDDKGYQRISLELGAKLPYDEVEIVQAVECSPNAAVSLARLGLDARLMSWIGDDVVGHEMVEYLQQQGVNTDSMVAEAGMKSNYHYVLRYGADRTKLQKFEDYSYQWQAPADRPDWLYLGVLGEKTWPLHQAILDYLHNNPEVKLVFQPGMYHLMWGTDQMRPFYERAEIVILNREEAAQVTGVERADIKGLINGMHNLGVTVAVVTDGADGAYASDGQKMLFMRNYPDPQPPLDRTGAGDAFASTIAAALALGKSLEEALEWAPINSMSVVQQMGAQAGLLSRSKLEEFLANAPEDYRPSEVN